MTFSDFITNVSTKGVAILIVIFMYFAFLFYKILVPSIVITFFTKLSLVQSLLTYLSFILTFLIIKKILNRSIKIEDNITPLEYIID